MTNAQSVPHDSSHYRIPLLVGVVGSRDLVPAQVPAIREELESLLRTLRDAQSDVRLQVMCSLAEGADLLVAQIAGELGIDIVALLPSSAEQCRAELTSDAARAAFDAALRRAERLDVPLPPEASAGDPSSHDAQASQQRERAGALIALYSSLLVVVWDGNEVEDRATARSVERRLGRAGPAYDGRAAEPDSLLYAEDNDLMYEIRCSRLADPSHAPRADAVRVVGFTTGRRHMGVIAAGIPPELAIFLERTAGFNRDVAAHEATINEQGRHLMQHATSERAQALAYVDRLFTAADWLGAHFRRCYVRALRARAALWASVVALLLVFNVYSGGVLGFATITGVLVIFGLAWLLARWARRRRWHRRYLDYRALAEGLRVDFYWELGGVRMQFDGAFAHESFLQKQDVELEWIRAAMRAVSLRCALYPRVALADGLAFTSAAWVGDPAAPGTSGQLLYYRQRAGALAHREHVAEVSLRVMLLLSLAVGFMLALDSAFGLAARPLFSPGWRVLVMSVFAMLTAYGAIFGIYFDDRSDRALIHQYRHMDALFSFAARELSSARSSSEKLDILRSLGRACLAEHAQWILAHRDKRVEGLRW